MSPEKSTKTATNWRRTRHLREALALVQHLDGEHTVPEAAALVGTNSTAAWRIMATFRCLAEDQPELVKVEERQEGRRVYYKVMLLPGVGK